MDSASSGISYETYFFGRDADCIGLDFTAYTT